MAKDTFNNLSYDKKEKIFKLLKAIFQEKAFKEVTVKEIVTELDIARGSFYQYFENLEDAYFTLLDKETEDIHKFFLNIFGENKFDLEESLNDYGDRLSEILFDEKSYLLYKNRYIYWDESLNQMWLDKHNYYTKLFTDQTKEDSLDLELMNFIKAVIHSLIKRNYKENWSKDKFLETYKKHISWIMKGVN